MCTKETRLDLSEDIKTSRVSALDAAIVSIDSVVDHLRDLETSIGLEHLQPIQGDAEMKSQKPTLVSVLDEGPERIRNQCDTLHALIVEIASRLC